MNRLRPLLALALLAATAGCYHAVIDTGRPASATVVTKSFAPSFIYGLVPPAPLNVSQQCTSGVAKVETMHTFVEGLVAAITWGIFTPMSMKVTCAAAAPGRDDATFVTRGLAPDAQAAVVAEAIERARTSAAPVYIKF